MWRLTLILPLFFPLVGGGCSLQAVSADDEANQSLQAVGILNRYCAACHGAEKQEGGLRLDTPEGFAKGGDSELPIGGPESFAWQRIADGEMPPRRQPQPTEEEKRLLQAWLTRGATFPTATRAAPGAAPADGALAEEASQIFRKHCFACHGQQFKAPGLDFGKYETLVFAAETDKAPHVAAGNPEASLLWKKIANDTMPPKSQSVRMTTDEKAKIRAWIAAGAPRWTKVQAVRQFVSELDVHTAIRDHLKSLPESARRHQRYFTFVNLHNNKGITNEDLALYKAALAKVVNSLTWESDIVIPRAVDIHETVYAIDLRDLDWTEPTHWNKLFDAKPRANDARHIGYSYGLDFEDPQLEELASEIKGLAQSPLAKLRVRADWFVVKAARPPLYHELLELPATLEELERRLEVNTTQDWLLPDLMRGAVIQSKVSTSNRLLDRHRALHGAYWISYDFQTSTGKGDLTRRPLGPKFANHPFEDLAFEHDGGEVVFTLPNGLNGYYLADGQKRRIAVGPIAIVSDPNQNSGTPEIVTGLSCIACHKHGVVRFKDDIRAVAVRLPSRERRKLEDLYAPVEMMDQRLARDEERFLRSLLEVVRPFLKINTVDELRNLPNEPVSALAQVYYADLTPITAAAELGFESPEKLLAEIPRNNDNELIEALRKGVVIKRERWESREGSNSGFQNVALKLGMGVPVN